MNLNKLAQICVAGSIAFTSLVAAPGSAVGVVPATIGIATAVGTFKVNSADVEGNANVFEGSQLKTGRASSEIFLRDGAVLTLASNSSATVYKNHFVLEDGTTRINNMGTYSIQAAKYEIRPDVPSAESVVRLTGEDVQVAAVSGSLSILDERGVLLTHIGAGTASAFNRNGGGKGQSPAPNYQNRTRPVILYAALVGVSAGLGLATDAILQKAPRNSISP